MNEAQTAKFKITLLKAVDNSNRLEALEEACGYLENGTQESVLIFADDATREWFIRRSGKVIAAGKSFMGALEDLLEKHRGKEDT